MFTKQRPMFESKPCHNCRRSRLKCDQTAPHCRKCHQRGRECLGYDRLLRWEQGIASRGKWMGKTFGQEVACSVEKSVDCPAEQRGVKRRRLAPRKQRCEVWAGRDVRSLSSDFLWDPVMQDLDSGTRGYLAYFGSGVCKDLVLYDHPEDNHFRRLIPLTHQHPLLLHVIIASSALHMSNAATTSWTLGSPSISSGDSTTSSTSPASTSSTISPFEPYYDALVAKQRALRLLKTALSNIDAANVDVILATVLLFVQFELIDSGRNTWKPHISGAKKIIEMLAISHPDMVKDMSELRRCLVANCLVYDILGTTLTNHNGFVPDEEVKINVPGLLQDTEGNHCSSFPVVLLQLLQTGSRIAQSLQTDIPSPSAARKQDAALEALIHTATVFDPIQWASQLQGNFSTDDLCQRQHIASAHRSAVCIYLSRLQLAFSPQRKDLQELNARVPDIVTHISKICPDDPLLPATAWPTFVAGAETDDPELQEWLKMRFTQIWDVQPWGLIKGAIEVLNDLWRKRRLLCIANGDSAAEEVDGWNWIEHVKAMGVDWLIL